MSCHGAETRRRAHDARDGTRDRTGGRSAPDGAYCFPRERLVGLGILARGLGPAEFGIYGVIISVLTWTQLLLNGGVPGATAKLFAEQPERAAAIEQTARAVLISGGFALFAGGWLAGAGARAGAWDSIGSGARWRSWTCP